MYCYRPTRLDIPIVDDGNGLRIVLAEQLPQEVVFEVLIGDQASRRIAIALGQTDVFLV